MYDCYICNYELDSINNSDWLAIVTKILSALKYTETWENCGRNVFITKTIYKALQNYFLEHWERYRVIQSMQEKG